MTETDTWGWAGIPAPALSWEGLSPPSSVMDPQPEDSLGDRLCGGSLWNSCQSMCSPEFGEPSSTPNSALTLNNWFLFLSLSTVPTELRIGPQKGKKGGQRTSKRAPQSPGVFGSWKRRTSQDLSTDLGPLCAFPVPSLPHSTPAAACWAGGEGSRHWVLVRMTPGSPGPS